MRGAPTSARSCRPMCHHARSSALSGGIRGDNVTTRNAGGYFGDQFDVERRVLGLRRRNRRPVLRLQRHRPGLARLPRSRRCRIATSADRPAVASSPAIPISSRRRACSSTQRPLHDGTLADRRVVLQLPDRRSHRALHDAEPDFFFFRNRGRGRIEGFEVETHTDLGQGYRRRARCPDFGRGDLEDDGSNLDDISPDTFLALRAQGLRRRARTPRLRMALLAEDDRPGPSEVVAPGATVIDLAGGYRLTRNLELRGIVRNLLDDSYYASPDPRWVWAPGRSASLRWPSVLIEIEDCDLTIGDCDWRLLIWSPIINLQSTIPNRQSSVCNLQFSIPACSGSRDLPFVDVAVVLVERRREGV